MDKGKKRERNVNFSREETEKLVSLVETYKKVIENKKSDAVTWQEKEKAWKDIETEFNSSGTGAFRDAKHLKLKYEALKRDTRKKSSVIRLERYKTGGGVNEASPLTPVEQKVKEMILLSVEGGESVYDSDQLDVAASEESGQFVVIEEATSQPIDLEGPMLTDTDTADYTNNLISDISEKPSKKRHLEHDDAVPSTSKIEQDTYETTQKKWAEWKPSSLKSKKHPALCKPKEKRPFEKLAEGKMELLELQKQLIKEELEEKLLKKQMMRELHELEKEQMILKIDILKTELEKKKNVVIKYKHKLL